MEPSELGSKSAFPISPFPGGLTFRELATLFIIQGLLADPEERSRERIGDETCSQATARLAVQQADDLIVALYKSSQ